jgi:hypothetical protein
MYVLFHFPQISETYIRSEIEAVKLEFDVRVVTLRAADMSYRNHEPYVRTHVVDGIERAIREFQPDVLHTHWLTMCREIGYLAGYFGRGAGEAGIPFTVRSHSFDVLEEGGRHIHEAAPIVNSDLCLGVLAFPFAVPILERNGLRREKLVECWPVVNYARFHDESPNGREVMNVGACLPKKRMEDFLKLATLVPDRRFNLYPMGYRSRDIDKRNEQMGHPVNVHAPVEPELMLPEYKKHEWLVYTAALDPGTVGWSLAVAEAQAAGVGVCFPRLRPDLDQYVGPAGFLYDSIEEVAEIVSKPFPADKRRLGFEHARRSDVAGHVTRLTSLWRRATGAAAEPVGRTAVVARRADDGLPDWGAGASLLEVKHRIRELAGEIERRLPPAGRVVFAGDAGEWRDVDRPLGERALPFVQREGQFWGLPADDNAAIDELERERSAGASAIVFTEANLWWLDHYRGFADHLRRRYTTAAETTQFVAFDLR